MQSCPPNRKIDEAIRKITEGQQTISVVLVAPSSKDDSRLATALKTNTKVTSLEIKGCFTFDDGTITLADALKNHDNLTTLKLKSNFIGSTGAIALAKALNNHYNLTALDLSLNSLGIDGTVALAGTLNNHTKLTTLKLSANEIGDTGAIALASALNNHTKLTTLELRSNKIGNAGAIALASALKNHTNLAALDLSLNEIGNVGAIALAKDLKNHANLTTLNISMNNISSMRHETEVIDEIHDLTSKRRDKSTHVALCAFMWIMMEVKKDVALDVLKVIIKEWFAPPKPCIFSPYKPPPVSYPVRGRSSMMMHANTELSFPRTSRPQYRRNPAETEPTKRDDRCAIM